jgi:hypothetical protein
MRAATMKIYRSFAEFERDELHKLDSMANSIDDMLGEMFAEELDFDESQVKRSRLKDESGDD